MRILHIISSGGMYGAEAVILNLSRTLNEHGHSSLIGIFSNSSNPNLQLHERALAEGIESHLIPCNGPIDRTVPASIRTLAASTNADLIHAHGSAATSSARPWTCSSRWSQKLGCGCRLGSAMTRVSTWTGVLAPTG